MAKSDVTTAEKPLAVHKQYKLKKKSGSFELWTEGTFRAFVIVTNGGDMTNRVTVTLMSSVGNTSIASATRYFNILAEANEKIQGENTPRVGRHLHVDPRI